MIMMRRKSCSHKTCSYKFTTSDFDCCPINFEHDHADLGHINENHDDHDDDKEEEDMYEIYC